MPTISPELVTHYVQLPLPVLPVAVTLQRALSQRRSTRAFGRESLSAQQLSGLLWSAFGINRPDTGGRTAPSAHNGQETSVFVLLPEGSYRYDAPAHRLRRVGSHDLRRAAGLQDFVGSAPLNLVYVADFARMDGVPNDDERAFLAAIGAGCIAQNVGLYCAAAGLGGVVRALIDRALLASKLGLKSSERVILAHSVGPAISAATPMGGHP